MKLTIGLIIAFAALVFVYNLIRNKKRRKNHMDAVSEFQKKYRRENKVRKPEPEYSNYITKYNSKVDYVEKDKIG